MLWIFNLKNKGDSVSDVMATSKELKRDIYNTLAWNGNYEVKLTV